MGPNTEKVLCGPNEGVQWGVIHKTFAKNLQLGKKGGSSAWISTEF